MAEGRRRETSRHRSAPRFAPPDAVVRAARVATPVLSLLPAEVALVVVQSLSPAAQRLPTGASRFDLAAAWLGSAPGALVGSATWFTAPPLGRVQLGLLLRALHAGEAQSVLAASHGALLLLTALQAALLWLVIRRLGGSGLAAGAATTAFGIAPIAVAVDVEPSAASVAVVWLLLAVALALGPGRVPVTLAAGSAAAIAVASSPACLVPVVVLAATLVLTNRTTGRRRSTARPVRRLRHLAAGFVGALVTITAAAAVLAAGRPGEPARALDALSAAQGDEPSVGAAGLAVWVRTDPVLLLIALVATLLVARTARTRALTVLVVVVALGSVWPLGDDAVMPLLLLLPAAAAAIGAAIDLGIAELGHPVLLRSIAGSGWLMGVAAVLVVAVATWLLGLESLVPGAQQPVARAEHWLRTSVPAGQVVLVGVGAYPDLERSTRATVGWYAGRSGDAGMPSSLSWARTDYVVTDSSLAGRRAAPAGAALQRSLRVARFGSGQAEMEVRAVRSTATPRPTVTPPTTDAERRAESARVRVGEQLARNPRIRIGGSGRALLLGGEVDSRAAIVLAQFVTDHRITVSGFGSALGDRSGIRTTVLISAVDGRRVPADASGTGALLRFLSQLGGDYAVRSIDSSTSGVRASFTPDRTFAPTAS